MGEKSYWIQPTVAIPKEDISLPAADQIGNRAVVPFVTCFTTDESFAVTKFTEVLKAAVAELLVELPFLAGQISWESKPNSTVKIVFPNSAATLLRTKSLPHLEVGKLSDLSWPLHALVATELCPPLEAWNCIGSCFTVQANFIHGGLILVTLINHIVADGITMMDILKIFGRQIKRFENGAVASLKQIIDPVALSKESAFGAPTKKTLADWQDYRVASPKELDEEGSGLVPTRPSDLGVTLWYMSSEDMHRLRSDVGLSHVQSEQLSFTCCLSALLWRVLSRARGLDKATVTTFLLSIQVRGRVEPQLHPEYCGNALVYSRAKASVAELSSGNLADLGLRIKRSIDWWTPQRIREYWGSVENCQNLDMFKQNWNRDGVDLELSSLMNAPFWQTDWGNGLQLSAQRIPAFPFTDGFVQVLPRLPDGGIEIILHLAKETLRHLICDPTFTTYVTYRCGTDPDLNIPSLIG